MRTFKLIGFLTCLILVVSCQKYDYINPNVPGQNSPIAPSILLNTVEYELSQGPGIVDGQTGSVSELPSHAGNLPHYNQFLDVNNTYYGGFATYTWSNTAHTYGMLKDVIQMENLALSQLTALPSIPANAKGNAYAAIGKFLRAYIFIWLSERVGDIPMTQAGNPTLYITPKYDTQHDVYKACLNLLDTANTMINTIVADQGAAEGLVNLPFAGDIFGFTGGTNGIGGLQQWQKVINAYTLRTLISLSNKDGIASASDLNIRTRFSNLVNNSATYPLLGSNADNLVFMYNASVNLYSMNVKDYYDSSDPICATLSSLLDSTMDPRTFVYATPALNLVKTIPYTSFKAYNGAPIDSTVTSILSNQWNYSYTNYNRYFTATYTGPATGDEAKGTDLIGYAEMCFNIAEGITRGWSATGNAQTWFDNGINASMKYFAVTDQGKQSVYDVTGVTNYGTVTFQLDTFLNHINNSFTTAANATAQEQIIVTQKYVAFWMNSGWQAFYNWRRTGWPTTFVNKSSLFNGSGVIPRRWQYPSSEAVFNTANWTSAVTSQYGGVDDLNQDVWINNNK